MTRPEIQSPKRLVIADFDPYARAELKKMLEPAGYTVVAETEESEDTLHSAYCLRVDLVLLGSDLPLRGGIAVAAQLHQHRIAPAILLLDRLDPQIVREATSAGVLSILVRPLREASLIPALEVAWSQWRTNRQAEERLAHLQEKERTRQTVEEAKRLLMTSGNLTEKRAYRLLQVRSMHTRRPMREVAEAILLSHRAVHSISTELSVALTASGENR